MVERYRGVCFELADDGSVCLCVFDCVKFELLTGAEKVGETRNVDGMGVVIRGAMTRSRVTQRSDTPSCTSTLFACFQLLSLDLAPILLYIYCLSEAMSTH